MNMSLLLSIKTRDISCAFVSSSAPRLISSLSILASFSEATSISQPPRRRIPRRRSTAVAMASAAPRQASSLSTERAASCRNRNAHHQRQTGNRVDGNNLFLVADREDERLDSFATFLPRWLPSP